MELEWADRAPKVAASSQLEYSSVGKQQVEGSSSDNVIIGLGSEVMKIMSSRRHERCLVRGVLLVIFLATSQLKVFRKLVFLQSDPENSGLENSEKFQRSRDLQDSNFHKKCARQNFITFQKVLIWGHTVKLTRLRSIPVSSIVPLLCAWR